MRKWISHCRLMRTGWLIDIVVCQYNKEKIGMGGRKRPSKGTEEKR